MLDRLSEIQVRLVYLSNEDLNRVILKCTELKRERRLEEFRKLKDKEPMTE